MSREQGVLAVVAAGGAVGALARAGVQTRWSESADAFPWATLSINVLGCFLLGMLTVLTTVLVTRWWVRPLLGTGFLGGFTTFSSYVVWADQLVLSESLMLAAGYVVLTPATCVAAAWAGSHAPAVLGLPHGHAPQARVQE